MLLAHELVHALDDCRGVLDTFSCDQIACTEVRAAKAADCAVWKGDENARRDCVRRHAEASLNMHVECFVVMDECLERAMKKCYDEDAVVDNEA